MAQKFSKKILIGLTILATGGAIWWIFGVRSSRDPGGPIDYRPVVAKIELSPEQRAQMPAAKGGVIELNRYGMAISLGAPPVGAKDVMLVGQLDLASSPEVDQPIYLCRFGKLDQLDPSPSCSGTGQLLKQNPVGFTSKKIRTGFRLMLRCRGPRGLYVSLNPRCEAPEDRMDAMLGAIRE